QQHAINTAVHNSDPIDSDNRMGAAVALAGMRFYREADQEADAIASLTNTVVIRPKVAPGIVSAWRLTQTDLLAHKDLDMPFTPGRVNVDFYGVGFAYDRSSANYLADANKMIMYNSSALENETVEETFNAEAVSTAK